MGAFWLVTLSLGVILQDVSHSSKAGVYATCVNRVGSGHVPQVLAERHVNTITIEPIKAKKAEPWMFGESVPVQVVKDYIIEVFTPLGEEAVFWALCTAQGESGFNPHAVSPNGLWHGVFQYVLSTYYGNGGTDWRNWKEMVRVTVDMYSRNQQYQWGYKCK